MEFLLKLLLVFFLVLLNGFFVATEFALVAVRKTQIATLVKKGNKAAGAVQNAINHLDTYISATQLGITIASLALGWVGEPALAHFFEDYLKHFIPQYAYISSHALAVALAFTFITFLHIVLGELAPKTLALQRSESTALFVIRPMQLFAFIFKPFIFILNGAGNLVLKLFGVNASSTHQLVHSIDEIKLILTQSGQSGILPKEEVEMFHNVFRFGNTPIKDIMIPRTDLMAFDIHESAEQVLKETAHNPYSRYPVYKETVDNIVGYIHVRDIVNFMREHPNESKIKGLKTMRAIINVPETRRVDDVLLDMRKKRSHIAVVVDEYGGTAGLVTLEDVIESLVGEIEDEFDQPYIEIQKNPDGSYTLDGRTPLIHIKEQFGFPTKKPNYSTIAGYIFGILGREPKVGDKIAIDGYSLVVIKMRGKRITQIKLQKNSS